MFGFLFVWLFCLFVCFLVDCLVDFVGLLVSFPDVEEISFWDSVIVNDKI